MKSRFRVWLAAALLAGVTLTAGPAVDGAAAATAASSQQGTQRSVVGTVLGAGSSRLATVASLATASLESVATKAGETGRNVAMSLIGLALAIAAVVLAFRRDFKEAAAVFAVGLVCVLMATSAGETLLQDTVNALVGS